MGCGISQITGSNKSTMTIIEITILRAGALMRAACFSVICGTTCSVASGAWASGADAWASGADAWGRGWLLGLVDEVTPSILV